MISTDMTIATRLLAANVLIGAGVIIPLSVVVATLGRGAGSCGFWRVGTSVFAAALVLSATGVVLSGRVARASEHAHGRLSAVLVAVGLLFMAINGFGLWSSGRTLAAFWHQCIG